MALRPVSDEERIKIGLALGDPFVTFGHPLTCNGGNLDFSTHHPDTVEMLIDERGLVCPQCSRVQELPRLAGLS